MSADQGPSPPSAAATGSDKAPAPKAAATFSSFINKNTTGKKFAPKAARRRPVADSVPGSTPVPSSTPAPETPASTAEPQVEPQSSNAPAVAPSTPAQLPTPAATQDLAVIVDPTPSDAPPDPAPTNVHVQSQVEGESHLAAEHPPAQGLTTQYLEDDIQSGRSPKRRRIEHSAGPPQYTDEASPHQQPDAAGVQDGAQSPSADTAQHPSDSQVLPQPRKRRNPPWVAVNDPAGSDGQAAAAAAPTQISRQLPKSRARKNATEPATAQDSQDTPAVPKKTRKPKKNRAALSSEVVEGPESEVGRIADEIVAAAVQRKPKARRRKRAITEGEEIDGVEGDAGTTQEKKRKGRPPRENTPSDAENQVIDPDVTYMDSLAARTVRWGKLSAREKEMRTIDWEAVKRRRREEDSKIIVSKAEQEAADRALAEAGAEIAAQAERRPQLRLNADGILELVPDSGTIDRGGDAERELDAMIVTEDQDITARLTTRSFMKNNKRFPNEFLLPGQGRRWNSELTELFYQGLRSFGTDFQMISQMFPGFTRRSIKTKFTREERENPQGVKEALQGRSELTNGGWGVFLEKSNKTEESFADADEIKRQMAAKEAEFKERIAAAHAEAQERKRQRELAGIDEDGNPLGDGAANKENGKGKKKRGKNKQVAFQEEQGVEIVGHVGDDDTWGQE
ncbi:hypothetical protein COCCADRAFT_105350 [Bipolaris zeicola 26-R-13]|uniref:Transcription factor TFIIIB component B'' Myb domain-containing protein n=1 Tax=Cochliobolus carbonum (strain 26-R-13) TaxID=930089 RepID=W6XR39_COCC2|nr:uncharacterized protein COCCADRAFT_105350 [Bipolaris zeicola 26-R-13]EUC29892.1 hypothetical protein COCCADRAFT_105350 [Bipolaris zeicola 26-R-13]